MTTPKEALRVAKAYFRAEWLKPGSDEPEKNLYAMVVAAIPVAELHEEIVEALGIIRHGEWQKRATARRRLEELRDQLEALK